VRRRTVAPAGKTVNLPTLTATKAELIQRVHHAVDKLESFQMKADMSPSVGNIYGGEVTDYATISGVILFKRPEQIRVVGLDPVVHSTAFDMVSVGNDFLVSIPVKNQFIEGRNDLPANSSNKLENLRPIAFRTSLLINPPDDNTEITILIDDTNETKSVYILLCVHHDGDQFWVSRNLYFDRHTLQISRQKTFDTQGNITSDTTYGDWQAYSDVSFPSHIDIQRPREGYELDLKVTEMKMNADLGSDKFVLNPPPNAQIKTLK
jgi:hypothetical protein